MLDSVKGILVKQYEGIEKRIHLVLDQLSDEQVNWRPNDSSNSIANLIVHISGNTNERISKGINNKEFTRNREQEFEQTYKTVLELKKLLHESFTELIETTRNINQETLYKEQIIRERGRTNLEILMQCAAHFSEHMGQIFYIAKIILDDKYTTTT